MVETTPQRERQCPLELYFKQTKELYQFVTHPNLQKFHSRNSWKSTTVLPYQTTQRTPRVSRGDGSPVHLSVQFSSVQFSSVAQSCPTPSDAMNPSTPGLPVHHQLLEFTQTQVHQVSDAIQPSHPLSSPSSLAPNPSQHQSLFQWVNSSHEVAKVLEFQL